MSGPGQDLGRRLERLTGERVRAVALAGSQHRWEHYRVTLADGRPVFVKAASADLGGVFEAEAQGLRWLGEARAVPVPDVLGCDGATLAVSWVPSDAGGADAAERFGRDLAALHAAGADRFGTPWPGFIASLPLGGSVVAGGSAGAGAGTGDTAEPGEPWAGWYAAQRLEPYLRRAVDAGALGTAGARLVTGVIDRIGELAGPAEPPSRIHGDCWSRM